MANLNLYSLANKNLSLINFYIEPIEMTVVISNITRVSTTYILALRFTENIICF